MLIFLLLSRLSLADTLAPPAELVPSINRGRILYVANCTLCHQVNGRGVPGTYPPLAESGYAVEEVDA